jgi:hypothetical protein
MMSILESRYGHVVERLLRCWGDPRGFEDMFNDLVFDSRGNRSGWPTDVWLELQFLEGLHKLAYDTRDDEKENEGTPVDEETKWV